MENSIYLGLSRQMTLQTNMDIVANNIANMNTSGYRGQNLLFQEYLSEPRGSDPLSFVNDEGQYQITKEGPVRFTGNQLHIALNGPGFIGVEGPGEEETFTRDGSFKLDANGALLTQAGFPVMSAGGGTITIPAESTEIKIDELGNVSNQNGQLGQIQISEFENVQQLEQRGNNLYAIGSEGSAQPAQNTRVIQGSLEGSNVEPVLEMTHMIDTLREFQTVQNILQSENERMRSAIQKLTGGS